MINTRKQKPETNLLECGHLSSPEHFFYVRKLFLPSKIHECSLLNSKQSIKKIEPPKPKPKLLSFNIEVHLTSAPSGFSSSPQLVRLQKLKTPPGFSRRITCALREAICVIFFVNFQKPDEVEVVGVPLSIRERVGVIQDPVKVAGGEAGANLKS